MDSDKHPESTSKDEQNEAPKDGASAVVESKNQDVPADALSMTPDELDEEKAAAQAAADTDLSDLDAPVEKKLSPIKRFFRKVNVYFLIFVFLVIVAGVITLVNYLNSQKTPTEAAINSQSLSQDALKQLANTDASVGNSSQTLTIQGNAIISGQTLTRGNLNVAGNLQTGGSIQAPTLTISGTSNLANTQINSLQVATNTAVQGTTTLRDLTVSGASNFSGAMTASQITVTRLILSGNATLEIPNHISFTGPTPTRTINNGILGNGGSSSLNGSDTSGTVNVGSGNNPTSGCFIRITFQQQFSKQPHVIVSPIGEGAGQTQFYVERDTSGFSICSAIAPPANKSFAFDYIVTN